MKAITLQNIMNTKTDKQMKTRKAILERLKRQGAQTAPALSKHIGVTPMAVRLHLYDLAAENLIDFTEQKSTRGRPAKYWNLTQKSQDIFPDAHQALAVDLLNSIKQEFGQKGLDSIVSAHSQNQLVNYQSALKSSRALSAKLEILANLRTQEGYMASAKQDGNDWLFCENHCPICSAAKTCTKLCANELWVFQQLLGGGVQIKREEHILAGARRCQYRISPVN